MPAAFTVSIDGKRLGQYSCRDGAFPVMRKVLYTKFHLPYRLPSQTSTMYLHDMYDRVSEIPDVVTIVTKTGAGLDDALRAYINELRAVYPSVAIELEFGDDGFSRISTVSVAGTLKTVIPAWWWTTLAQRLCGDDRAQVRENLMYAMRYSQVVTTNVWYAGTADKNDAMQIYPHAKDLDGIPMLLLNMGPAAVTRSDVVRLFLNNRGGVSELAQETVLKTVEP